MRSVEMNCSRSAFRFCLKGGGRDVSCGGSSDVEHVDVDDARPGGPVDVEEGTGGGGSGGAILSLLDGEWLVEGTRAMDLVVDLAHRVGGGGPRALEGVATGVLRVGGDGAREALDVSGWVVFRISLVGGHGDERGVSGPHSNVDVNSLDPHVKEGVGWKVGDANRGLGGGDASGNSASLDRVIDSVEVERVGGRVGPFGADVDDVSEASVGEANWGRGLWVR
jgi:hypothetical protein